MREHGHERGASRLAECGPPPGRGLAGAGEWLRWQVNYRVSWPSFQSGRSSYRQDTLDIAVGPVHPELFFGTPTWHVDERAFLR